MCFSVVHLFVMVIVDFVYFFFFFFFQAEDGIRDVAVTGVQTCALPIYNVEIGRGGCTNPESIVKIGNGVGIFENTIINPKIGRASCRERV